MSLRWLPNAISVLRIVLVVPILYLISGHEYSTALELLLVLPVLVKAAYGWPDSVAIILLGVAVLVTVVISGSDYLWYWSNKARMGE